MSKNKLYKHLNKPTKKELEVLELISKGYTNKQIADLLFNSLSTINTHLNNLYKKHNLYITCGGDRSVMRLRLVLMFLEEKEEVKQ